MKKTDHDSQINGKSLIIPVFIMNSGCPHRCIFCNQRMTAGNFPPKITGAFIDAEVRAYLAWNKDKSRKVEIAFYGGSFTGVDPLYQEELLSHAYHFIQEGRVDSIRISTRPDYISEKKLPLLKKYGVGTVEIGAQSFVDEVLEAAQRGHDSAAINKAIKILKRNGFRTGLHLMAGLPEDSKERFMYSVEKTIELRPDMVRIHPVIVFSGTGLADQLQRGNYKPLELAEAVELCRWAWQRLSAEGIRIIRMGVQVTPEMEKEGSVLAGPIHPSFGSLVLSSVFLNNTVENLKGISNDTKEISFKMAESDVSSFRGINNMNIGAIKKLYPNANLIIESFPEQPRGSIIVKVASGESFTFRIP